MEKQSATSFDYFGKTPSGVEMALHVDVNDVEAINVIVGALIAADQMLSEAGFTRSERLDKPARGGGGRTPTPPPTIVNEDGETVEVKCGKCQGPIYDNRDENRTRIANGQKARPDFACKNKDGCGWVQWPPKGDA